MGSRSDPRAERTAPTGAAVRLSGGIRTAALGAALLANGLGPAMPAELFAQDPLTAYRALPPDSVEARSRLIAEDVAGFRMAFDSVLVADGSVDPDRPGVLARAAEDFLQVTGDSLLVSDLAFVTEAAPERRRRWSDGVREEETAWRLQAEGKPQDAAVSFRQAARIYAEVRHLRREAVAWGSAGVACWMAGDFDCVGDAYHRALAARRRLGDALLVGRTLNGLGSLHFRLSHYDSALVYYEEARRVREALGRPADLGTTLVYLGNVYFYQGDLGTAQRRYQEALDVLGPEGPARAVSDARVGLANVASTLGDHREAVRIYEAEAKARDARGEPELAAPIRANLGDERLALGDHAGALREFHEARRVQTEAGATFELSRTLLQMGNVYWSLSEYPKALDLFTESLDLARESQNRPVAGAALVNLGRTYHRMGLTQKALESLEEARRVSTEPPDPLLRLDALKESAVVEKEGTRDPERALALHDSVAALAGELGLPSEVAINRVNRANVLADLGRHPEALGEYRRSLAEAEDLGRRDIRWPALLGLADVHERTGRLDSAAVYNREAIGVMEELRGASLTEDAKAAFLGQRAYIYEAQIHVLARLYQESGDSARLEEIFSTAERGKARALLDILEEGHVDLVASLSPGLRAQWETNQTELNSLRYRLRTRETAPKDSVRAWTGRLRDLEAREGNLLEQGRLENPGLASAEGGRPQTVAEIRETLLNSPGTVLLEYALGDSTGYLLVVTRERMDLHRLPPRGQIEVAVRRLRSALSTPAPQGDPEFVESAVALYRWCLAPAEKILGVAESVFLVPDGTLQYVPFEVLLPRSEPLPGEASARARAFSKLPYALRNSRVHYGPSATVLAVLRKQMGSASSDRSLLAVGDPVFRTDPPGEGAEGGEPGSTARAPRLAPLPQTRTEVEAIAREFPARYRKLYLGEAARESTLTAPGMLADRSILHFATHGLVNERRPERSSLALSYPRSPAEDGYLEASEIYRLELDADLVVLSACETGVGRMVRGEGVLGLPRAFLHAGARSVVVSLWSVSDRSTSEFMVRFYRALVSRGATPAEALGEAKKELRSRPEFSHPFYWAPFILIGPPASGIS